MAIPKIYPECVSSNCLFFPIFHCNFAFFHGNFAKPFSLFFTAPPNLHTQPPESWALPASRRTVTSRGWMHFSDTTEKLAMEFSGIVFILGTVGSNFLCRQTSCCLVKCFLLFDVFFKVTKLLEPTSCCWIALSSVHSPKGFLFFLGKFSVAKNFQLRTRPVDTWRSPPRHQHQQKPDVLLAMDRSDLDQKRSDFSKKGAVAFLEMERCWGRDASDPSW